MHHAFLIRHWHNACRCCFTCAPEINLQLIIHEERRLEVKNLKSGVKVKSNAVVFS